jgi:CHASE2 domain-containing sensor protein
MDCNLEPADRSLRMTAGVFLLLAGLLLLILCYLELFETWWFIVAGALTLCGVGAVLSAAAGKCMLRKAIGH